MKLSFVALISLFGFISCNDVARDCSSRSTSLEINVYNDILKELNEQHFYNLYLGEGATRIQELIYQSENSGELDTVIIRKTKESLHQRVLSDSSGVCTIFLDTVWGPDFGTFSHYMQQGDWETKFDSIVSSLSANKQAVLDSLNTAQNNYSPHDFNLCTANVLYSKGFRNNHRIYSPKCEIGIVAFSRLYLNSTSSKGLLYFNFLCGTKCGFGRLLVVKLANGKWAIESWIDTWIS